MKKIIFYILICFSFCFMHAQKIKIEGFVKQPEKGFQISFITVNDTINKLNKLRIEDRFVMDIVISNKDLATSTDHNNYFSINVKPSDSLFFMNDRRLYYPEKYAVSDLMKKKDIVIEFREKPCITPKECNQEKPTKKYVFVGKKINISRVSTSDYCYMPMDSKFNATYKIEQEFGNHFQDSTITFTAYDHDHSHRFLFEDYSTNVLLFVGEYCGDLIHERYQFFPVYKTKDGNWAGVVDATDGYYSFEKYATSEIAFDNSVYFDYRTDIPVENLERRFPKKYYTLKDGKAYPIMGISVENLIKLKSE